MILIIISSDIDIDNRNVIVAETFDSGMRSAGNYTQNFTIIPSNCIKPLYGLNGIYGTKDIWPYLDSKLTYTPLTCP
jgi:hypothetical protein